MHASTEHHYDQFTVERNLCSLFVIYLKSRFIWDFVTLLPLKEILADFITENQVRVLLLIKLIRLYIGFQLLDHKNYMKQIKQIFHDKIQALIDTDPELAANQVEDNNYISKIIYISYLMRTF